MLNIRPLSLLLILVIVIVLFGAKRLRNIGGDLAAAIKGFREGMGEPTKNSSTENETSTGSDSLSNKDH